MLIQIPWAHHTGKFMFCCSLNDNGSGKKSNLFFFSKSIPTQLSLFSPKPYKIGFLLSHTVPYTAFAHKDTDDGCFYHSALYLIAFFHSRNEINLTI